MSNLKVLNIKVPPRLYDTLKIVASKKHISLASIVRLYCSEGLERDGYSTIETDGDFLVDLDAVFADLAESQSEV